GDRQHHVGGQRLQHAGELLQGPRPLPHEVVGPVPLRERAKALLPLADVLRRVAARPRPAPPAPGGRHYAAASRRPQSMTSRQPKQRGIEIWNPLGAGSGAGFGGAATSGTSAGAPPAGGSSPSFPVTTPMRLPKLSTSAHTRPRYSSLSTPNASPSARTRS